MPGVYISYPFCAQKCTYCNFASGVQPRGLEERYLAALIREISVAIDGASAPDTLYIGGGTPSALDPPAIEPFSKPFLTIGKRRPLKPHRAPLLPRASKPGSVAVSTASASVSSHSFAGNSLARAVGTMPNGSAPANSTVTLLISAGPQQVVVPSVKGQSEASATAAIQAKGLDVNVTPKTLSSGDPNVGRVTDQNPSGGTSVAPNSTVTITVGVASSSSASTTTSTTSP